MLRLQPHAAPTIPCVSPADAPYDPAPKLELARDRLCTDVTEGPSHAAQDRIDSLISAGLDPAVIRDLLMPDAARRLGELWVEDRLSFSGVALGMTRLTSLWRTMGPGARSSAEQWELQERPRRPVLLALTPGEHHAFGIVVAADRLRREGWDVNVELRSTPRGLAATAAAHDFILVGLSVGSEALLPKLERTIAVLRKALAPGVPVVVGGHLAIESPELVESAGADAALASPEDLLVALELAGRPQRALELEGGVETRM